VACALAIALALLVPGRADAVTIDGFGGGPLGTLAPSFFWSGSGAILPDPDPTDGTYDIVSTYSGGFTATLLYFFSPTSNALAGNDVVQLEFGSASTSPPFDFTVTVQVDAASVAAQSFNPSGQSYPKNLSFDFSGTSEAGLGSVDLMIVTISTPKPGAFTLNEIRAVPEPTPLAMLGLGLLGLGRLGRKQRPA
jgi:hypothetical protein